jgi:hypothetical protein
VDLGVAATDREVHRHRSVALAARLRDDRVTHRVEELAVRHRAPDLVERDDSHPHRIRRTDSRETLRPEITKTAGPAGRPTLPASAAATVTAADGSMRY